MILLGVNCKMPASYSKHAVRKRDDVTKTGNLFLGAPPFPVDIGKFKLAWIHIHKPTRTKHDRVERNEVGFFKLRELQAQR